MVPAKNKPMNGVSYMDNTIAKIKDKYRVAGQDNALLQPLNSVFILRNFTYADKIYIRNKKRVKFPKMSSQ